MYCYLEITSNTGLTSSLTMHPSYLNIAILWLLFKGYVWTRMCHYNIYDDVRKYFYGHTYAHTHTVTHTP